MTTFKIPTVTVEDLQSFQAKHFPAAHAYPTEKSDQFYIGEEGDEYYDYDDLGYYPDGVKRTLTDEQIRIFRHSEIHALQRKKQAREEEEKEGVHAEHLCEVLQSTNTEGKGQGQKQRHEQDKGAGSETSSALDYDDGQQVDKKLRRQASSASFTGRRIISYED